MRKRVGGLRQVRSIEENVDSDGVGNQKERARERERERERDMLVKQRGERMEMYSYSRLTRWGGRRGMVRSEETDKDRG